MGLELVKPPLLVVDANGNTSTVLTLKNRAAAKPVSVDLSDFSVRRCSGKEYLLGTRHTLTGVTDQDRQILGGSVPLAKDGAVSAKLEITNFWEAGQGTAILWDGATRLGEISAVRVQVPFNVQIVSAVPDPAELHLATQLRPHFSLRGFLTLKNADPMTYCVVWKLWCSGLCSSVAGDKALELPGNSTTTIELSSPRRLGDLPSSLVAAGTLKDDVTPGALELQLAPDGNAITQPLPSKRLDLKTRTSFWGSPWQQMWNLAFLCLFLFIGGTLSVVAHYGIPNTSRALALRKRLEATRDKLNQLGSRLDSRWRSLLAYRLGQIHDDLSDAFWIFPDFATTLDLLTESTASAEQWIDLAAAVSLVKEHAEHAVRDRIPPTLLRWTEQRCERALGPLEQGSVPPEQLEKMKEDVKQAQQWLDNRDASNPELEKAIAAREERLAPMLSKLKLAYAGSFDGLLAAFEQLCGKPLVPADYADRDAISIRVDLLNEYEELLARASAAAPPASSPTSAGVIFVPPLQPGKTSLHRLRREGPRLLSYVGAETHESLNRARVFVEEMRQDIYTVALNKELAPPPPKLNIRTATEAVKAGVPVNLSLRFNRPILNEAAAAQEWKYVWAFNDVPSEEGWSVHHTFEQPGPGVVTVEISDLDGNPVDGGKVTLPVEAKGAKRAGGDSTDRPSRMARILGMNSAQNRLELGRLIFALAIAVFALLAAARQQIQNLSLLEAAAAAVALGFGADTVRNLLTQKAQ